MYSLKKILLQSPGHYIGALILAVAMGVFRFSTLPEGISPQFAWYEVFSVSGYVTFLTGALLTVSYFGAFDLFSYVFSPGRVGEHRKYKSYAHYTDQKTAKRSRGGYYFVPYYVVGVVIVLISRLFT